MDAIKKLRIRTEYEVWLLEAVYEIIDQSLDVAFVDDLIYPVSGGPPTQTMSSVGNIRIGNWRPGFLEAGAPLVFVTAFKLLDMLVEWVLNENGKDSTYKFAEKIAALKSPVHFPPLIENRMWLRERLIALYENLEPLRGTIIHNRHFMTKKGALQVSSSKRGKIGPPVSIASSDLRNLAFIPVSLFHYIEGSWTMDLFREKLLRRALDELEHLHGLTSLGQLPPGFLTVRVYVKDEDPVQCDLARIRRDVAAKRRGQDVMFNIRIVTISSDGFNAKAYLIPWEELQNTEPQFSKMRKELAPHAIQPPSDINLASIARDMNLTS